MAISVGDTLPDSTFNVMGDEGPEQLSSSEYFKGKKVVLFAVPGAFTPTCHNDHVPSYLDKLVDFKLKEIDEIACLSVNDVFVMNAWKRVFDANEKITFLADGNAEFVKALGLELDLTAGGLGIRSQRFSMLVNDGKVEQLFVEADTGLDVSSADNMLENI